MLKMFLPYVSRWIVAFISCILFLSTNMALTADHDTSCILQNRKAAFKEITKARYTKSILQSVSLDSSFDCAQLCLSFKNGNRTSCVSYNYKVGSSTDPASCELSSSKESRQPEFLIKDNEFSYYENVDGISMCTTNADLGIENGQILDSAITSSSVYTHTYQPYNGRLNKNLGSGSWTPAVTDVHPWLQVDFGVMSIVSAIATQGAYWHSEWAYTYSISYSNDEIIWEDYLDPECRKKIFQGNFNRNKVTKYFEPVIISRYIRLFPLTCNNHCSMRIEYYGCREET